MKTPSISPSTSHLDRYHTHIAPPRSVYSSRSLLSSTLFVCSFLWLLLSATSAHADALLEARLGYRRAYQQFKQQQWQAAQTTFTKTLGLLQQRHTKLSGRDKHLNTLGISDIYYHLALIALQQNQSQDACRQFDQMRRQIQTLPSDPATGWTTWPINPLLPERFADGNRRFNQTCVSLPSRIILLGLPPNAVIELQPSSGPSTTWLVVTSPIAVTTTSVRLRISAPNYERQTLTLSLPRWATLQHTVTLKKNPKPHIPPPVRIVRRPPPLPPPPPKTSPWVWVGVGLGAAAVTAGTVTAVYFLTRPTRPSALKGNLDPNAW